MVPVLQPKDKINYGAKLVSLDGRVISLRSTTLSADAKAGVARVTLEQVFENSYEDFLEVLYSLPLPADGVVSGFSFQIGEKTVKGEIDRKKAARERYEEALISGRSAALLEQERSSLFRQRVGNIPPGARVVVTIIVDQKLLWLSTGFWEWRFPTVLAPRYMGSQGQTSDAQNIQQVVTEETPPTRAHIALMIRDSLEEGAEVKSPSHPLQSSSLDFGHGVVLDDQEGAVLDRDIVVRWPVARESIESSLDVGYPESSRPHAEHIYGLLTLLPPKSSVLQKTLPRDLIVLLDTSGSMHGKPIAQAKEIVCSLIESLSEEDQLEMIEFSSMPRRWKAEPQFATKSVQKDAKTWIKNLRAGGGTDMHQGILEAFASLREDAQRQVILVTDGLIGFESKILSELCQRLPKNSRVHTVGVGSSVNRSLTTPAARAGRGVEVIVGLDETPALAIKTLLAHTQKPVVTNLQLNGSALVDVASDFLPDLYAGAPALLSLKLHPEGGFLTVFGETPSGKWEQSIEIVKKADSVEEENQAVVLLYGREKVEDLELRLASGENKKAIEKEIESIGLTFQISTRLTSWVAIDKETQTEPGHKIRQEEIPQEVPYGMSVAGFGLRRTSNVLLSGPPPAPSMMAAPAAFAIKEQEFDQEESFEGVSSYTESRSDASFVPLSNSVFSRLRGRAQSSEKAPQKSGGPLLRGPKGGKIVPPVNIPGAVKRPVPSIETPQDRRRPSTPKPEKKKKDTSSSTRTLPGHILLLDENTLVLEIRVEGATLLWKPENQANLIFKNRKSLPAKLVSLLLGKEESLPVMINKADSTQEGVIPAGKTIRLSLQVDQILSSETILQVTLLCAAKKLLIRMTER